MGEAKRRRECPAVGRGISAAECGANRGSAYVCPEDCVHNPWSRTAYSAALAIEDRLQEIVFRRLGDEMRRTGTFLPDDLEPETPAMQAYILGRLFLERDAAGRTFVQRWAADGFAGLGNDERLLLQWQAAVRPVLLEVLEVRSAETVCVRDRLVPDAPSLEALDRSLAGSATRFLRLLAWTYTTPHYERVHGLAVPIPEVGELEAEEIVGAIARHLGGPAAGGEPLRAWLAEHSALAAEALHAVMEGITRRMIATADMRYFKIGYRLQCPPDELAALLGARSDACEEPITAERRREGFTRQWVLLEDPADAAGPVPAVGRPTLGTVLLGPTHAGLDVGSEARARRLRAAFERLAGDRVAFEAERVDDLGKQMLARRGGGYRAELVPPALLEHAPRIATTVAQVPLAGGESNESAAEAALAAHDRRWLDEALPSLSDRTPRQAAADAALRPTLVRLVKSRIRMADRQRRDHAEGSDTGWLARELGLDEIDFPAPPGLYDTPPAAKPAAKSPSGPVALRFPAPPLPDEPLSIDEVQSRLVQAREPYSDFNGLAEAFADEAPYIFDWASGMAEDFHPATQAMAVGLAAMAWFLFFPRGCQPAELDPDAIGRAFEDEMQRLRPTVMAGDTSGLMQRLEEGRQPYVMLSLMGLVAQFVADMPKRHKERDAVMTESMLCLVFLKVLVEACDRALRGG